MSPTIQGMIVKGFGVASQNLKKGLLAELTKLFPEIAGCCPGTINVKLDLPLKIYNPQFISPRIRIMDNETFGLHGVEFECPLGTASLRSWILLPERSPHRVDIFYAEIMTGKLDAAVSGARCALHILGPHTHSQILII